MGRPQSNGLVELHDAKIDSKVFFCMDLVGFMFGDETTKDWDVWHEKFTQAKNGRCPYRDRCQRYARAMAKRDKQPYQLTMF